MPYDAEHIKIRLHGLVASRLQSFLEDANAARAANPQVSSAQGHATGRVARAHCYGALERTLLAYVNYCKSEQANPRDHIADVESEIKWLMDEMLAASRQGNVALVTQYLEPFIKDAHVAYHEAKTGRLHDE